MCCVCLSACVCVFRVVAHGHRDMYVLLRATHVPLTPPPPPVSLARARARSLSPSVRGAHLLCTLCGYCIILWLASAVLLRAYSTWLAAVALAGTALRTTRTGTALAARLVRCAPTWRHYFSSTGSTSGSTATSTTMNACIQRSCHPFISPPPQQPLPLAHTQPHTHTTHDTGTRLYTHTYNTCVHTVHAHTLRAHATLCPACLSDWFACAFDLAKRVHRMPC